jgi:hypothetical protein
VALLSLVISIISILVAISALEYARRSTDAAERSAKAGEESAFEASRSREVAETSTVHAARQRAILDAPDVYVLVHQRPPTPTLALSPLPDSPSEPVEPGTVLSVDDHGDCIIAFTVSGVIVNHGSKPVSFRVGGMDLIEGESDFFDRPISVPPRDVTGRYILAPGQVAQFSWEVSNSVERWRDMAAQIADDWGPIDWEEQDLYFSYVNHTEDVDNPGTHLRLVAMHCPVRFAVYRFADDSRVKIKNPRSILEDISVRRKIIADLPETPEDLKPRRRKYH